MNGLLSEESRGSYVKACGVPRAFLFDFGGVIATEGFRRGLEAIARAQGLDPDAVQRLGPDAVYESGYVLGKGTEAAFWDLMRERAGITGTDAELSAEVLRHFRLRPGMLETVRRLRRAGFIVAILSDQTDWLERLDEEHHFSGEFDRVFNSYRRGKGKHDPSVFTDVIAELGLRPEAALFVDDNPANVERARSRGLRALLFRSEGQFLAEFENILEADAELCVPSPGP